MPCATLTSKGQITLPKEVRARLGVAAGDQVEFRIADDGTITLERPQRSARSLYGVLHRDGAEGASIEEMDEAIARSVSDDDRQIRDGR